MGINTVLSKFFGNKSDRDIREIMPYITKIHEVYPEIEKLDDDALRNKTTEIKQRIKDVSSEERSKIESIRQQIDEDAVAYEEREKLYDEIDELEEKIWEKEKGLLEDVLPEVFSVVKETARRFKENETIKVLATQFDRDLAAKFDFVDIEGDYAIWHNSWVAGGNTITWDMVHYEVQLIGGVVLHQGKIAEMATGEGKTLVATLPVFLNALVGRGVHLVTVNDYLAKRDSEWMGPLYQFHGLSVDCIDKHQPGSESRRKAYKADITFGTNNEFGFDYLRDNMAFNPSELVQRKHHYAIVDEVDSVLIDDARTPLIISGPVPKSNDQQFEELKPRVEKLVSQQRHMVTQLLTEAKQKLNSEDSKVQDEGALLLYRAYKGYPKYKPLIKYLSEQGIKARMLKTENLYMQENMKNMHIVTDPLYFVIDEKLNSVELTDKGIDILTGDSDDPKFFILPNIGETIAEIEKNKELKEEAKVAKKDQLLQDYAVKSERVHTVTQLLKAYSMFEKDDQYVVIDNKVKIVDEQTGRIMEGRRYSDGLHQAIEAKERVKVEAATQTMATITLQNYFRMYEKLAGMTGTAETEAGELWDIYKLDVVVIPTNKPIIRDDREDKVYKTKREKYNAVAEEIVELTKAGRPVLVGTTSVEISELLSRMLKIRGINHNVLNAKLHQKEADIVAHAGKEGMVTIATNMAGRGTDIKLTPKVKEAGGLAIIGTERHESRRVDRQLRGRAGRQGDPGSSQFYVSLEDDLMRLFSSDRIVKIMDRLGLEDGEVIQHSMISKSIERAQKKVEENNFGIRKRLLEYDDVMNSQREVIYTKRKHALLGERMGVEIANMLYDTCEGLVGEYHDATDYEGLRMELFRIFAVDLPVTEDEFTGMSKKDLFDKTYNQIIDTYKRKQDKIATTATPVIRNVYESKGEQYTNIMVPISDGKRMFQISANLERAYKNDCKEIIRSLEKNILLLYIDEEWKEHLRELDDLRQSVQNATYEQKDPLLIYKFESFNLFKTMIGEVNRNAITTLMRAQIPTREPEQVREAVERRSDMSKYNTRKDEVAAGGRSGGEDPDQPKPKAQPVRVDKKVGRNDPCPCGSGKKYKQCHGKDA
ncbi:preprotein translocase subunit SecA [Saccharicrinis sp. FJH54]|uniref:preprotein translocase subunit SecA n=1 Tax=Saccharicrinis sp. FJH54 TaxID=3344665 RepID=UPI0035D4C12E